MNGPRVWSFRIRIPPGLCILWGSCILERMAEKNRGGRPRLRNPLSVLVPVRFTEDQVSVLDEALAGMGITDRSTGVRALALAAVMGGRVTESHREERAEGEARVGPVVPQTVFVAGPPMPDPEMAE